MLERRSWSGMLGGYLQSMDGAVKQAKIRRDILDRLYPTSFQRLLATITRNQCAFHPPRLLLKEYASNLSVASVGVYRICFLRSWKNKHRWRQKLGSLGVHCDRFPAWKIRIGAVFVLSKVSIEGWYNTCKIWYQPAELLAQAIDGAIFRNIGGYLQAFNFVYCRSSDFQASHLDDKARQFTQFLKNLHFLISVVPCVVNKLKTFRAWSELSFKDLESMTISWRKSSTNWNLTEYTTTFMACLNMPGAFWGQDGVQVNRNSPIKNNVCRKR